MAVVQISAGATIIKKQVNITATKERSAAVIALIKKYRTLLKVNARANGRLNLNNKFFRFCFGLSALHRAHDSHAPFNKALYFCRG